MFEFAYQHPLFFVHKKSPQDCSYGKALGVGTSTVMAQIYKKTAKYSLAAFSTFNLNHMKKPCAQICHFFTKLANISLLFLDGSPLQAISREVI